MRGQHGPAAVRGPERHPGPRRAVSSPSAACARGTASAQAQTSFRFWEAAPGPTRQTPEPLATKPGSATHGRCTRQHPAGTVLLGGGGSLRHPCLGTRAPAARNACCGDRRLLRAGSRARGPAVPLSCVSPPPSHSQGGGEACSAAQQRDGRLRPATGFPASSAPTLSPGLGPPNAAGPRASAVPPVVG